jgi:hypothetical protein
LTAPALPGAAPDPAPGRNDPARLPEDVAVALTNAMESAYRQGWVEESEAPRADKERAASNTESDVAALRAAIRAALDKRGEVSPAAGGSAAHVAPPVSASFEAALAALDVEVEMDLGRGVTFHTILGLDAVRAAHAEAVRVAVEAEREACAVECDERSDRLDKHADEHGMAYYHDAAIESRECAAAIRERGATS